MQESIRKRRKSSFSFVEREKENLKSKSVQFSKRPFNVEPLLIAIDFLPAQLILFLGSKKHTNIVCTFSSL